MPRPRQQVIDAFTFDVYGENIKSDALKENDNELLEEFSYKSLDECNHSFVDEVLKIMLVNYKKSGDLKLLAMGCKTIIEIIEKD